MQTIWDETRAARQSALWLTIAFVAGVLLGLLGKPAPVAVSGGPWMPAGIVAPLQGPTDKPSPPAAVASASAKTRVVIERPAYPQPPPPGGYAPGVPTPSPVMERIVIETEGAGSAVAPIVTPPPPILIPTDPGPGAIGITVGPFPGKFAISYAPVRMELLNMVTIGPSVMINTQLVGVGGQMALSRFNPRLYCEGGVAHEYKLTPDPKLYWGAGWRF